jgi:hypothetical protein
MRAGNGMAAADVYLGGDVKRRPICTPYFNELCPKDETGRWTQTLCVGASAAKGYDDENRPVPLDEKTLLAVRMIGASIGSGDGKRVKNMSGDNHPALEYLRPTLMATIPEVCQKIRSTPCMGSQTFRIDDLKFRNHIDSQFPEGTHVQFGFMESNRRAPNRDSA